MKSAYQIRCDWDDEAKVWYVSDSNVPGLSAEAATVEAMGVLLEKRIPELLDENGISDSQDVPFDLISAQHRIVHRHVQ